MRILVVDDDMLLRGMAARTLRHAGFDVTEADSGEQALTLFDADPADLILLDVMMGGIDGYETCHRLRALPSGQRVPVLMLTGLNDTESIERAYEAGATDFITKPIQWALLTHRVRYGLRAAAATEDMRRSREGLARAQRMVHMGHWSFAVSGAMSCSEELARIFGAPPQAMACATPAAFLSRVCEADRPRIAAARTEVLERGTPYQLVYTIERFDGATRTVFEQVEPQRDSLGRQTGVEGITQDITERVEAERQIQHLSLHDTLTGLPNRHFFLELAEPALEQARRQGTVCAFLHVDIDRFKTINDALGHADGDRVLQVVAARLQTTTRAADLTSASRTGRGEVLARIGGNAFTVMLLDIGRAENASVAAERLLQAIGQEIDVLGRPLKLTASIGVAVFPRDAGEAADLTRFAEQALYECKKNGGGHHRFFDEEMNAVASARLAQEADLRRAISQGELRVHLQPKIDARHGTVVSAEALVRWQHPTKGLVPPGQFIPLAEETGLILPLTDWVLGEVARLLGSWARQGHSPLPVSVNVTAHSFMADGLAERLVGLVQQHQIRPGWLMLEVTESMLMTDVDHAIARLQALRSCGFKLSLDDFGTGYSSLSYVKRFPIDELKIDRAFVMDVHRGGKDGALVAAIVALARMLDLQVVAEGVETQAQSAALQSLGCHLHQGFLYGRPMPVATFEQFRLASQADAPAFATTTSSSF